MGHMLTFWLIAARYPDCQQVSGGRYQEMAKSVLELSMKGEVGLVVMTHPPVNALGIPFLEQLDMR